MAKKFDIYISFHFNIIKFLLKMNPGDVGSYTHTTIHILLLGNGGTIFNVAPSIN